MSELEYRPLVVDRLRFAGKILMEAGEHATEAEEGTTGLYGSVSFIIGGLTDAVNNLAELIEEKS